MSRTNAVTGMVIDERLKRDVIIATLTKVGAEYESPPDEVTTESLATSLHLHYAGALPLEKQIRCKQCHGIGNEEDDTCPYCGCEEGDAVVAPPAATATTKTEAKKTMATEAGSIETPKDDTKKANGKALAKDDTKPSSALRAEHDLDEAIKRVKKAQSDSSRGAWQLGKYIADIKDNDLWKLRTHKDTKTGKERPRWASWDAFCTTELGMTPRNALSFQNIAAEFSAEQVAAMGGTTKAALVLLAPPEARAATQKMAEKGATAKQIKKHVKKARASSKNIVKSKTSKATAAAATKAKATAKTITVANVLGSVQVKLYKKPANLKGLDLSTLERAKKLADEPFGVHDLENGVKQFFSVMESPAGELILKVVTKRDDE
jgi:hypothetical protein